MVEAAIFIPIFLAAVLTLVYLSRVLAIQETAVHVLCDEARSLSSVGGMLYETERFGNGKSKLSEGLEGGGLPVSQWSFSAGCSRRMKEEWGASAASSGISEFRNERSERGITDLIHVRMDYRLHIPIPLTPVKGIKCEESLTFRPFIGVDGKAEKMGFGAMEREEDSTMVWVFPRAGERYHLKTCSVVSVDPEERILSAAIRKRYAPCSLCEPQSLLNGSAVYCFSHSGQVYHRASCAVVSRYVTEMERTEAEREGYTPCLKCGGGVRNRTMRH